MNFSLDSSSSSETLGLITWHTKRSMYGTNPMSSSVFATLNAVWNVAKIQTSLYIPTYELTKLTIGRRNINANTTPITLILK